jgi:excisionase family DNA binding protein
VDKTLQNFYKNNPQIRDFTRNKGNLTTAKAVDKKDGLCYLNDKIPDAPCSTEIPSQSRDSVSVSEAKRWLNSRELAEYIGSTPEAIRKMVIREKIPAYRPFGKTLLFDRHEIDRKIQAHPVKAWYEKD